MAGVSPITVSRVFNRPEMVASGTLEHVRRVIERTGYVPNMLAGGLASRRTRFVAAIVPAISSQIFSESIQSLTDRLWESGYQVLLGTSGYPTSREESLLAPCRIGSCQRILYQAGDCEAKTRGGYRS